MDEKMQTSEFKQTLASLLVGKPIPEYLRLLTEEPPAAPPSPLESLSCLAELCQAFERTTGWALHFQPGAGGETKGDLVWSAPLDQDASVPPSQLAIARSRELEQSSPRVDLNAARSLASPLAALINELIRSEQALWRREAELAAGVPVLPRADEVEHLAARLEAVLETGAKAIGFEAAALYLLDDATSVLKLRAVWGLPRRKLAEPARPLRGAMADLEALLGHVVVLDNTLPLPGWKGPENFPTAVCVPVATPSVPLGTLWLFARQQRELSDDEAVIAEIVGGRIAADLEREMLLSDGQRSATLARSVEAAGRWQQNQLPRVAPLVEGWQFAGFGTQAGPVGGSFFDWFSLARSAFGVVAGNALDRGIDGALLAAQLRGALRSHAEHAAQPARLLDRLNHTIWTTSTGDQHAALFYATVDPASAQVTYGGTSQMTAIWLHRGKHHVLPTDALPIGAEPEAEFSQHSRSLSAGDVLIAVNHAVVDAQDESGRVLGVSGLVEMLEGHLDLDARDLAEITRRGLEAFEPEPKGDRAVLIVKHATAKQKPR